MLLNLIHSINLSHHYLLLLLPQFSLNLPPQNLKRAQQSWSAKSQQAAAQTGAALVSIVPSSSNGNLPSMDPWLAPRAVPGSSHGPEIATRCSPVTDRVNETRQYTRYRQRMMGAWDSNRGCHLLWGPRLRETIWRFLLGPRTPVAARAAGRRWIAMLTINWMHGIGPGLGQLHPPADNATHTRPQRLKAMMLLHVNKWRTQHSYNT